MSDLLGKQWWHRVADLSILRGARTAEEVVVGKCLDARSFAYGQAATLRRVIVDIVMAVLRDMASDSRRGAIRHLNAKAIIEVQFLSRFGDVPMCWQEGNGKVAQFRRAPDDLGVGGRE